MGAIGVKLNFLLFDMETKFCYRIDLIFMFVNAIEMKGFFVEMGYFSCSEEIILHYKIQSPTVVWNRLMT